MLPLQTAPLLISILAGLLLGLLAWWGQRVRRRGSGSRWAESSDDLLVGLLVLGAFGLGVFLTYVLLSTGL